MDIASKPGPVHYRRCVARSTISLVPLPPGCIGVCGCRRRGRSWRATTKSPRHPAPNVAHDAARRLDVVFRSQLRDGGFSNVVGHNHGIRQPQLLQRSVVVLRSKQLVWHRRAIREGVGTVGAFSRKVLLNPSIHRRQRVRGPKGECERGSAPNTRLNTRAGRFDCATRRRPTTAGCHGAVRTRGLRLTPGGLLSRTSLAG
mmetsp:Transcript_67782/g.137375  ORF Transcript_67782/g.137375 Transcript_67782/m.137375 type:complete len:201 (-) Transcript_67782:29-631(-)